MTNVWELGRNSLIENDVNEDALLYLVLPFIKSTREGVQRLRFLIEK